MNILIVEDNPKIRKELQILLETNHYQVTNITDFKMDIVPVIENISYDLLLLDINLPNQNGFDICKQLKVTSKAPVIFVTSRSSEEDELKSIMSGSFDFITKPYNKNILLEKIKRCLNQTNPINYKELKVKDVILDLHLSVLKYRDQEIELTRNEFRILYYFFMHPNKVITKEELLDYLWNEKYYLDDNILTVNMNRLRKKLEDINQTNFIKTVRGKGYQL